MHGAFSSLQFGNSRRFEPPNLECLCKFEAIQLLAVKNLLLLNKYSDQKCTKIYLFPANFIKCAWCIGKECVETHVQEKNDECNISNVFK